MVSTMSTKRNVRRRKARALRQNPQKVSIVNVIPQIRNYDITCRRRLFYETNAQVTAVTITAQNIGDTQLIATSATQGYALFSAWKLRSVRMWAVPNTVGNPVQIAFEWFQNNGYGFSSRPVLHSCSSMGLDSPAVIFVKPEKTSLQAYWQTAGGGANFFTITCPPGTIIEVTLDCAMTDGTANAALQNPIAGATAGEFYYRGLDGVALATTKFVPPAGTAVK